MGVATVPQTQQRSWQEAAWRKGRVGGAEFHPAGTQLKVAPGAGMLSPPQEPCSEAWTCTHHVHNANFPPTQVLLPALTHSHLHQAPSFSPSVSLWLPH